VIVPEMGNEAEKVAPCSCGSGIPVQKVQINGQEISLVALPLIFENFRQDVKKPSAATAMELLETVRVYNRIPEGEDEKYREVLLNEYAIFCEKEANQ